MAIRSSMFASLLMKRQITRLRMLCRFSLPFRSVMSMSGISLVSSMLLAFIVTLNFLVAMSRLTVPLSTAGRYFEIECKHVIVQVCSGRAMASVLDVGDGRFLVCLECADNCDTCPCNEPSENKEASE